MPKIFVIKEKINLKYGSNYRLSRILLLYSLIILIVGWLGDNLIVIIFVLPFLLGAFFSVRKYNIEGEILQLSYLLGLFPKRYDLRKVKGVKVIEPTISAQYSFSFKSFRHKIIKIDLENDRKLRIYGNTLHHQDYIRLIKKLKRK